MSLKWSLVVCIVSFLLGGIVAQRYFGREVVTEREKIVTKDKIVTVIKEIVKPDGTIEKDTTIVDESTKKEDISKVTIKAVPQWRADVGVRTSLELVPVYSFTLSRRILGPIMLGAQVSTDRSAGLVLGMEF